MRKTAVRTDFMRPRRGAAPKAGSGDISKCSSVSAGNHSTMKERTIFQAIALADVAMMVPAVVSLEWDWLAPITPLRVVLLAAIVAAAFVAVDHLSRI